MSLKYSDQQKNRRYHTEYSSITWYCFQPAYSWNTYDTCTAIKMNFISNLIDVSEEDPGVKTCGRGS